MRKTIIHILYCFFGSMLFMLMLFLLSSRLNVRKNGFVRLFRPHVIAYSSDMDLVYNSYYVAGETTTRLFLGNTTACGQLISSNFQLNDTAHYKLSFAEEGTVAWGAARLAVDSPFIWLMEGIVPTIITGTLSQPQQMKSRMNGIKFSKSLPISPGSGVFRVYDTGLAQNVLIKAEWNNPKNHPDTFRLAKQGDGIFSTDGMLLYNKAASAVFYIYYYRNEFIKLDTNLQLIYRGRTIDTIAHTRVIVFTDSVKKHMQLSSPPLIVNKRSSASRKWLFINSGLRANNEDEPTFRKFSPVDVYSVADGSYKASFYLPDHKGKKVSSFVVTDNNKLIAIYDHYLLTFTVKL